MENNNLNECKLIDSFFSESDKDELEAKVKKVNKLIVYLQDRYKSVYKRIDLFENESIALLIESLRPDYGIITNKDMEKICIMESKLRVYFSSFNELKTKAESINKLKDYLLAHLQSLSNHMNKVRNNLTPETETEIRPENNSESEAEHYFRELFRDEYDN